MGLKCVGPFTHRFFINKYVGKFPGDLQPFENTLSFLWLPFFVRIQQIIHMPYEICVYRLFMLLLRLLVNRTLTSEVLGAPKVICGYVNKFKSMC